MLLWEKTTYGLPIDLARRKMDQTLVVLSAILNLHYINN